MNKSFFLFMCFFPLGLFAQKTTKPETSSFAKNRVDVSYSYLFKGRSDVQNGSFKGSGFEIAYNRYLIKDKFYGRISYGKTYASTNDAGLLKWLKDDHFTTSVFSVGVGYDLIRKNEFRIGVETGFLNLRHWALDYAVFDPQTNTYDVLQYAKTSDGTIYLGVRGTYFLGAHLVITPAITYGFKYTKYETVWGKLGIGYRF